MSIKDRYSRRLPWEACLNARDLGGYPTGLGPETRWRSIVRSDDLSRLTDTGRRAAFDYGVRTVVDLRMPGELEEYPNPFAKPGWPGVAYVNVSLIDPTFGPEPEVATLADDYKQMLDRFQHKVAAIMKAIADAPDGGVLIHCAAGKDRTGITSALLLDLVQVPRGTIANDYALSGEYLRSSRQEWLENGPGERAERERALAKTAPRPGVMLEVLRHLDARHGSVERYLLQAGVTPSEVNRLRERLLP